MPYAYISSLSVKFLGSRRLLKIQAPINNGISFQTIIPDAYEVNITIEGLNDETKNFIYAAITGGSSSKVTVGSLPSLNAFNGGADPAITATVRTQQLNAFNGGADPAITATVSTNAFNGGAEPPITATVNTLNPRPITVYTGNNGSRGVFRRGQ